MSSSPRRDGAIEPDIPRNSHGNQQPNGERSEQVPERPVTKARTRGQMAEPGQIRKRALAAKIAVPREVPHSYREADAADKMLVRMKDKGRSWAGIRKAWEKKTGQKTAASTLPNRYSRLKDNLDRLKPGDVRDRSCS